MKRIMALLLVSVLFVFVGCSSQDTTSSLQDNHSTEQDLDQYNQTNVVTTESILEESKTDIENEQAADSKQEVAIHESSVDANDSIQSDNDVSIEDLDVETLPDVIWNEDNTGRTHVFDYYYAIATEDQKQKLDELHQEYSYDAKFRNRKVYQALGMLPEDQPRLTLEQAIEIVDQWSTGEGKNCTDSTSRCRGLAKKFNQVAGAADLYDSNSNIAESWNYYLDDEETAQILIFPGNVWYFTDTDFIDLRNHSEELPELHEVSLPEITGDGAT